MDIQTAWTPFLTHPSTILSSTAANHFHSQCHPKSPRRFWGEHCLTNLFWVLVLFFFLLNLGKFCIHIELNPTCFISLSEVQVLLWHFKFLLYNYNLFIVFLFIVDLVEMWSILSLFPEPWTLKTFINTLTEFMCFQLFTYMNNCFRCLCYLLIFI